MDDKEQFAQWCDMWDKARAEFDKEPKPKAKEPTHSYFGMQSFVPEDETPAEEKADNWRDIFHRANELSQHPEMLTEEFQKKLSKGPGPGVKFTHNPIHFSSHGSDQSSSPYEPVRVTPNFTDGKELQELNDLKVKLEKLESSLLAADIKSGSGKADYMSQLKNLRDKIDDLSNRLTPEPLDDVA